MFNIQWLSQRWRSKILLALGAPIISQKLLQKAVWSAQNEILHEISQNNGKSLERLCVFFSKIVTSMGDIVRLKYSHV